MMRTDDYKPKDLVDIQKDLDKNFNKMSSD